MYARQVEIAIGFVDKTWDLVTVNVPELEERALDEDEVRAKAYETLDKLFGNFDRPISFRTVLYVSDPEGGYAEDQER